MSPKDQRKSKCDANVKVWRDESNRPENLASVAVNMLE